MGNNGNALKYHITHVHEGVKGVICNICGKSISSEYNLKVHLKNFHENGDEKVDCKICGELFRPKSLQLHIETVHEKKKDHLCKLCGKTFSRNGLRNHMN